MRHLITSLLLLLGFVLLGGRTAHAQAADADPADFLPSGAAIRQTVRGDVDGDGREDLVALYSVQTSAAAPARAGLLILLVTSDGVRPVQLLGSPPSSLRGEQTLDPNGSTDLTLTDLNADGIGEIVMTVNVQYQEPRRRTMLWVFGRGEARALPEEDSGPPAAWAGTGFRLETFLEGNTVAIVPPGPISPDRTSALRREGSEHRFGGPDPTLEIHETFRWRDGAFRLAERSLKLPAGVGASARAPETAVLAHYEATARGDIQAAVELLSDELRASRSSTATSDPSAVRRAVRVEELRIANENVTEREPTETDRLVHVRVSMYDPRVDLPQTIGENDGADDDPSLMPSRYTIAGTWRTQKVGDQWRLAAAELHETTDLAAISAVLPPGVTVEQTAGANLRGLGVEDVAILVKEPGRFSSLEPYVLFGGPAGPERAAPLASYVGEEFVGAVGGTIRADDVNRDGKPEITFSAFVGAHSALLWVLQWDGATFKPLFAEVSNSPIVDLTDLDGDGVSEIVLGQSGYCGGYAASPRMVFGFRWENGAYRSASMRYPDLHDGIYEFAEEVLAAVGGDGRDDVRACIQHMLATSYAFQGRPAEARTAYQAYSRSLQQVRADSRSSTRPGYLGADYVEADLRAILAAADAGQGPAWSATERALLHDLLGDALLDQARGYQYAADSAAQRSKPDEEREARRKASETRQAATREYQAALTLDPTDEEARRALGE